MLNGSSINGAALNGSAKPAFVTAFADLGPNDSTFLASPTLTQQVVTTIHTDIRVDMDATQHVRTFTSLAVTSVLVTEEIIDHAAVSSLTLHSQLDVLSQRTLNAETYLDITAEATAVPNAVFAATGLEVIGSITADAQRTEFLTKNLVINAFLASTGSLELEGLTSVSGACDLLAEPSLTVDGVTTHEATTNLHVFGDLFIDLDKVVIFITSTFAVANAEIVADAHLITQSTRTALEVEGVYTSTIQRQTFTTTQLLGAATITPVITFTQQASGTLPVRAYITAAAVVNRAAATNLQVRGLTGGTAIRTAAGTSQLHIAGTLSTTGTRRVLPKAQLSVVAVAVGEPEIQIQAQTSLFGFGVSIAAAGVLRLVATPQSRHFIVQPILRTYRVASRQQQLRVAP